MKEARAKALMLDAANASGELLDALASLGCAVQSAIDLNEVTRILGDDHDIDLVLIAPAGLDHGADLVSWCQELQDSRSPALVIVLEREEFAGARMAMELQAMDVLVRDRADAQSLSLLIDRSLQSRHRRRRLDRRSRRDQETIVRLKSQIDELRARFTQQTRSFEESQEVFYLDLSRMMTIIDNIMDGIVFTDRQGHVTLMNPVAEALLSVKSFVAIGKRAREIAGVSELLRAIADDHEAVPNKRQVERIVEVHHSEQDLVYLKVQTTGVTDYKGTFAGILTVIQDITAEFKSDQLKNQYLSIVSHELRTPLTGIKTFATMLAKGTLGSLSEQQLRVSESMREQSLRLEHQIDKLIDLGRLDTCDFGQDREVFKLNELVTIAVEPFRRWAADQRVELVTVLPDEEVLVRADREDIKRALQALVENAVKFTSRGGLVEVAIRATEVSVNCAVRDTGIGIDVRYQKRIFEKFFQVEDPLTRHFGGAGLGLCVAKGIVEAHGSRIRVKSALGSGSEFSFDLSRHPSQGSRGEEGDSSVMAAYTTTRSE